MHTFEKEIIMSLTLIHPVRNTVKDLILFPIVCQLHSFISTDIRFEKNVEVWNVGLKKKSKPQVL